MPKKLIVERVIKTEDQALSDKDRSTLIDKRNKQLKFLLVSYVPLALILLYVFIDGLSVAFRKKFPLPDHEINEEDIKNFNLTAPWVCGGFFLILTIFFIHYYFQSAAPFIKDVKVNKKQLVFINPETTDMSVFNKYYLTTPIFKKQQLAISKEGFYSISTNQPVIMEIAPNSLEILRITSGGKEIGFY